MNGADGHVLLRKITNARKQINTIFDGLGLDVSQYIKDNPEIHPPTAPSEPQGRVALSPRADAGDERPSKRQKNDEKPPPKWLTYFNASKKWNDCYEQWPGADTDHCPTT